MLLLSNFNSYNDNQSENSVGLNALSTVFAVIFTIFNTILGNLILADFWKKLLATIVVYVLLFVVIFWTNFTYSDTMQYGTIVSIVIAITYGVMLVPSFLWITQTINDEVVNEMRAAFRQKDEYEAMFDGLQEGIIVVDAKSSIDFMNSLSNKMVSMLVGAQDFLKEKKRSVGSRFQQNSSKQLESKILKDKLFYVKQITNTDAKSKKSGSSDEGHKSGSSKSSGKIRSSYSLCEIIALNEKDLQGKIWSFSPELVGLVSKVESDSKVSDENLSALIKMLPCMKGIEDDFIPTFKFFKINKSQIEIKQRVEKDGNFQEIKSLKTMVCFIDIS